MRSSASLSPITDRFAAAVQQRHIRYDAMQERLATALDRIVVASKPKRSMFWRRRARSVRGLYIHGQVGRGKSMLVQWLAEELGQSCVHIHATEFVRRLMSHRVTSKGEPASVTAMVKRTIGVTRVLSIDEFYVEDIASAMVLSTTLGTSLRSGCALVFTSNQAPTDLYRGGLNRHRFLPAIQSILDHCDVLQMDGDLDHRRVDRESGHRVAVGGEAYGMAVDDLWTSLGGSLDASSGGLSLGRVNLRCSRHDTARAAISFAELCERPLGSGDYRKLVENVQGLLCVGVPVLSDDGSARRFISLVDELYERRVPVALHAAVAPDQLYPSGILSGIFARSASRLAELTHMPVTATG